MCASEYFFLVFSDAKSWFYFVFTFPRPPAPTSSISFTSVDPPECSRTGIGGYKVAGGSTGRLGDLSRFYSVSRRFHDENWSEILHAFGSPVVTVLRLQTNN